MAGRSEGDRPIWVGPEMGRGILGDCRLLLVSLKEPLEPGAIPRVGRTFEASLAPMYIDGTMRHQTFTDVARLVLGGPVEREACEGFWRGVAFVNLPGPSAGTRAHPEMTDSDLQNAADSLQAVINEYTPTAFILFDGNLARALGAREPTATLLRERARDWISLPHPSAPGFVFRDHTGAASSLLGSRLERSPS